MNIQWYPGHMAKTKRLIREGISLVDIVIEILDARIPLSSRNPDIDEFAKNKFRIVVLNKSDLSNADENNKWKKHFLEKGIQVVFTDCTKGVGLNEIEKTARELMREKIERQKARGRLFVPIRGMIVGIPNVGKSTLINKYVGKAIAKTGDKPGVTRNNSWIRVKSDFELLDTPGILWPRFDDERVGLNLAFTGAIKDEIMDIYTLSLKFIENLPNKNFLEHRYKISISEPDTKEDILNKIATSRGFKLKGGELDTLRASIILLDEFRAGLLGKITLETV